MWITPEWISAFANILMVATTAFGFRYVYTQIQAATVDHLYSRMHDIHKIFLDKPHLLEQLQEANGHEKLSAESQILAEIIADFFQQAYLELDHLPAHAARGWERYMKDIFQKCRGLHSFVVSKADWYDRDFVTNVLHGKME